MEQLGLITQEGCDLPLDRWKDSSFCLPFKISPELANYSPELSEKILQKPIPNSGKFSLFLEFKETTSYVLRYFTFQYFFFSTYCLVKKRRSAQHTFSLSLSFRVSVIYKQARTLAIDAERRCFKNYDIDQ